MVRLPEKAGSPEASRRLAWQLWRLGRRRGGGAAPVPGAAAGPPIDPHATAEKPSARAISLAKVGWPD